MVLIVGNPSVPVKVVTSVEYIEYTVPVQGVNTVVAVFTSGVST